MNYIPINDIFIKRALFYDCPICGETVKSIICPKCQTTLTPRFEPHKLKANLQTYLEEIPEGKLRVISDIILEEMYPADLATFIKYCVCDLLYRTIQCQILPHILSQLQNFSQKNPDLSQATKEIIDIIEKMQRQFNPRCDRWPMNPIQELLVKYDESPSEKLLEEIGVYVMAWYSHSFVNDLTRFIDAIDQNATVFSNPVEMRKKHEYIALHAVISQFDIDFSHKKIEIREYPPIEVIG